MSPIERSARREKDPASREELAASLEMASARVRRLGEEYDALPDSVDPQKREQIKLKTGEVLQKLLFNVGAVTSYGFGLGSLLTASVVFTATFPLSTAVVVNALGIAGVGAILISFGSKLASKAKRVGTK